MAKSNIYDFIISELILRMNASMGVNGNSLVAEVELPGANCTYGGLRIETRSGLNGSILNTTYMCNVAPLNGTNGIGIASLDFTSTTGPIPNTPAQPGATDTYTITYTDLTQTTFDVYNGADGPQGANGVDAIQPVIEKTDSCTVEITLTGGPSYNISAEVVETAWLNLEGFSHQASLSSRPKVKRIGNQLHFKGLVIIPLSSDAGTTLASLPYDNQPYNQVYTGVGGVNVNVGGAIIFNKGASVLPNTLNLCGKTIDDIYQKQEISSRQIVVSDETDGAALSAVFQIYIDTNGNLVVQTLKDIEDGVVVTANHKGGSYLRYITSNVRVGELVPDFSKHYAVILNAGTGFGNGIYTNVNLLSGTSSGMTADVIITGGVVKSVDITNYGTGYVIGDPITFSGTNAPGITAGISFTGEILNPNIKPVTTKTYLFSCDAAEPNQIGGFAFKLDGLIAYLD